MSAAELILATGTEPSAPASGRATVYVDSNDELCLKDSAGTVTKLGDGNGAWNTVTFNTGWGNSSTTDYFKVAYRADRRFVHLRGAAVRSSGTATTIFTLPAGYRPVRGQSFSVMSFGSGYELGIIFVYDTGEVGLLSGGVTWLHLDGIAISLDAEV
jgi:hypothetical protein